MRDRVAITIVVAVAALALLAAREGTPAWQAARVGAIAVLTVGAAGAMRARDRVRGPIAAGIGVLVVAIGLGFLPFLVKETWTLEALASATAVAAGAGLAVAGTVIGTRRWRAIARVGAGAGTIVATIVFAFVVAPAVAATNVPRPEIGPTPASEGLHYESVPFITEDGVRLAGWYVPSTNRAAVVLLHGAGSTRSDVLDEAAVLARHGFGVLLVDARGHGESAGRAMDFGWEGDADIAAATGYLVSRGDVDPERIGVVGMSVGGEQAIGATGTNQVIRAVVAEGATARTAADEAWLSDQFGVRGALQEQLEQAQDRVADLMTSASVPTSMRAAVEASGDTRYLLITAGTVADEGHAAGYIASAAPDRVQTWTVPGADHTGGLATDPDAWERRVTGFLEDVLAGQGDRR